MNDDIFTRYENKLSPFDGTTLYIGSAYELVSLKQLSYSLNNIVRYLDNNQLINELYMCDDWLQHDSYFSPKQKVEKGKLLELIRDEDSLYNNRHGNKLVHIGFYDVDNRWYLRIYVEEKYSPIDTDKLENRNGRFDITLSAEHANGIFKFLNENQIEDAKMQNSFQYFSDIITNRENKYTIPPLLNGIQPIKQRNTTRIK